MPPVMFRGRNAASASSAAFRSRSDRAFASSSPGSSAPGSGGATEARAAGESASGTGVTKMSRIRKDSSSVRLAAKAMNRPSGDHVAPPWS